MDGKTPPNLDLENDPKSMGNSGLAGRPTGGAVPQGVAGAVARLAADYLGGRLEKKRDVNMKLGRVTEESLRGRDPDDLLGRLKIRKSIPLIREGDRLTAGLLFIEMFPELQGGLQVLYGVYVDLLTRRDSLFEVHALIAQCAYSQRSQLFTWYRAQCSRNRKASIDELTELRLAMEASRNGGRWRHEFLDFLAVALGLFQEAVMTRDATGTRLWRDFLLGQELAFSSWQCSSARQVEMDEFVHALVNSAPTLRSNVPDLAAVHLGSRALHRKSMPLAEMQALSLVALYLSIRDGRQADLATEAWTATMALLGADFLRQKRTERNKLLRMLRDFRRGQGGRA